MDGSAPRGVGALGPADLAAPRDLAARLGRPLRIVRVITRLNVGGPARHVILLAAKLDPAVFTTTLVTGTVGPDEADLLGEARARGVQPLVIPELGRSIAPHRDLVALARLVSLFRRLRPDIVHTHTAKAGALGRLAARLTKVPLVLHTFHGHVLDGYFSPVITRIFLATERALARHTDRVVTISPRLREELLSMGIGRPEQLEVLPLGLDLEPFAITPVDRGALRRSLGLPPEATLLATIGRLAPIKDHGTLFAALAHLGAEMHLLVIGDGAERERLKQLADDLGIDSRVHLLGWRRDLHAMMAGMDVVISSSRNEGTPVALIEAMAAGVPVVATAVGGVPDLVVPDHTGWLCPPGDPQALAETVCRVLARPAEARRVAEEARATVLERHSIDALLRRMDAFYRRVVVEEAGCESW